MNVVVANSRHIEKISQMLVEHFERINQNAGYNKFNTNESSIKSVVVERIEGKSSQFHYFVLETPEGDFMGFVNTMIMNSIGQILVLLLDIGFDNPESAKALFSAAMEDFKANNLSNVYTEVTKDQPYYQSILDEVGGETVSRDVVFNI